MLRENASKNISSNQFDKQDIFEKNANLTR